MNQRTDQIVYLNNCELVIQSLVFRASGTYYIVWKKGKKNTQSNKFTISSDRILTPKETLSLSLKVYYHGATPQPRHTHLILFNQSGEQIERTKLMIHEWTAEYNETTINIGGGTIKIKGKRRGVMKLQKFHRLRSEVEETSEDESNRFLKKASNKQSNTQKDELLRLTKQVQDLNFLVDKLKQQRNSALVKIQKLEVQLSQVNDKMSKDLAKLREYFVRKTEMRESIYKQQIQQLVTSFNRNYELNYSMMQNLIHQKFDYEQEIRELKESNQEYIASQSRNFENLIADMQKHKQAVDEELKDSNEKIGERQARINKLNDEIDHLNEELEQMRNNYKRLEQEKQEEQQKNTGIISELNIKVTENEALIHEQTLMIERLTSENKLKEDQNLTLSNLVADHAKDKNELHLENMKLIDARQDLTHSNQILTMKNEQLDSELAQLHNTLTKMREEFDQLTKKNAVDLEEKYIAYTKDIEEERTQNLQLNTKLEEGFHQRQMQSIRIAELEGTIVQKDDEIEIFKKQLEHSKLLTEELTKEMAENVEKFKEHQAELSDRLSQYIQRSNQLQSQNTQLHSQIRQLHLTTQEQLMKMKEQYEILAESNKRLLEDQIDMLKKQKEEDDQATNAMRNQYEHQLTSLMESHRTEIEELEKVYKEDCDRKEGEIYLLLQDKNRLQEEFQAFKFKVQMDESNRQQEMALLKIKKGYYPDNRMQRIEEEHIEEVQSQEEEEEQIVPVKKQKLKKKPIRIEVPSEEEVESEKYLEESQQEQGQDDYSVFEILKERKKKKDTPKHGKLKVKKQTAKRESLELSNDLEEDQKKQPQIAQIQVSQSSEEVAPPAKMVRKPTAKAQKIERPSKTMKGIDPTQLLQQKVQLQQQKSQLQQRIVQLEQENQALKLSEKNLKAKFQRQQKKYTNKIRLLEQQIVSQAAEIEQLFLKINEQDSKFAESYRKEAEKKKKEAEKEESQRKALQAEEQKRAKIEQQRRLKAQEQLKREKMIKEPKQPLSPRSTTSKKSKRILRHQDASQDDVRKIPSKTKIVDQEKYKRKIEDLEEMLVEKQRKIERLQDQIRSLNLQLQRKGQQIEKTQMLESKHIQQQRQYSYPYNALPTFPSANPTQFGAESFMRQSITNLEDRVSSEKEKYSELKIKYDQKCKQNEDLVYQSRKLKTVIAELEQKDKRRNIPRSIQEMQTEIEDSNRKILQLSRSVNQAKLQRDSLQDEVRIVRKKLAQVSKQSQQSQSRAMQNEREVEDLKRKQQKAKRQMEQYQQDIKRLKEINRKNLQELSQVRKSQSQFIIQRKKVLDEVVRLEGVIAQKETDMVKLNKQMEKLKGKINQTTEGRQGREREYRVEMEKLEIQRSKVERKNRELQETIKILKEKIDVLEREAKKSNEERKQTYSQKLKNYINQIASIKQLVQQYQQEITQLKLQNSEFFQQNQLLKTSFQKLEIKYQEQLQKSTHLENELKALQQKFVEIQDQLKVKSAQEEKSKIVVSSLRKDLDNQRVLGRKKTQKLQQLQEMNERFVYDIKQLKIRLNQYENNSDDRQKMAEELFASQRTIGSLQEELNKISEQYHYHTEKYVYTLEDVQKAIKQIKQHEDQVKEEEFARLMQQLDQNNSLNRQNMQRQLLTLYNQNQKLRVNLHKSNQNYLELQLQLSELESLRERCKRLDLDKASCDRQLLELSDDLKTSKEQIRRLQIKFNESIRSQQNKSTENVILLQKYQDLNKRYQDLNQSYLQLKQDDKNLLDRYKNSIDEKDQTIQKLNGEIQVLNNKLLAFELEINRLKEIQAMNSQDYYKGKKKLEAKIEEINQSYRQKERESENQFKIQIRQLKTKTVKYEQELQQKLRRIEQLEEGVFLLQGEVEELTSQLTDARAQLSEENQLYTLEINKLRTKMKEDQDTYNNQLQNLEEELSAMSKELTTLKYARENVNGSRLRASRQSENVDERGSKRYQEKIKLKDRRIQQLKQTILVYEQKLSQYNRKQALSDQIQHYKTKLSQNQQQYQQLIEKKQAQFKNLTQTHKQLGDQYHNLKVKQQQLILLIQQKDMEINSLRSETIMINKLYTDLQKEIDIRKENIRKELQVGERHEQQIDDLRKECLKKDKQIDNLKSKLIEKQALLNKKGQELKNMTDILASLRAQKQSAVDQQRTKIHHDSLSKIKQLQTQNQRLLQEQKKLRNDLSLQVKQSTILKSQLAEKDMTLSNLLRQVENNDKIIGQNQDLLSKYVALNRQSLAKTGLNIDQLIQVVVQLRDIERSKQEELIKVTQELQELKFIEENRFIEHEQLKRQNYQLRRSDEERELCLLRIQQLEESLLKLQDQKQMLMFKLEAVKVQLANVQSKIADGGDVDWRNIKQKIRDLLEERYI